jgi:uncharacterized protein (TIGR00369 family)
MSERDAIPMRADMVRVPVQDAWAASVGFESWAGDDDVMHGRLPVSPRVCQPMGLVHGGIYGCVAEQLASTGTARAVMEDGRWCVGMSNLTHFFRSATLGETLSATARPVHRGRTTWVWEIEMTNDAGKLCAKSTVTMAVRQGQPPGPA